MTTEPRPSTKPPSRAISWLIGCVALGWLVVYNAMRLTGSSPAGAAWRSLAIGAVAGIAVFALGLYIARRLAASGRVLHRGQVEIPKPSALEPAQRDAMTLAWPALAALAALALVLGAYLVVDWLGTDPGRRATTTLVLGGWNVLAGLWVGDEAARLRRGEADGVESLVLGCALTAVLAGVGLSRDLASAGQVLLIVFAGVAGALASIVVWRLHGARGVPTGAIGVIAVAALALILPLTV